MLVSMSEKMAVRHMEREIMTEKRRKIYVACEDLNFVWCEGDVLEFDRMWHSGVSVQFIANTFKRDPDEVLLLLIDRAKLGYIKPRKGELWGRFKRMEVAE